MLACACSWPGELYVLSVYRLPGQMCQGTIKQEAVMVEKFPSAQSYPVQAEVLNRAETESEEFKSEIARGHGALCFMSCDFLALVLLGCFA